MHILYIFTHPLLQDTLSQITEYSEAAVTVRGTYIAPGMLIVGQKCAKVIT
jgi:hypothetical protein